MRLVALGEVATIKGGGTPSKSNPDFWGGDIPWISPKDMKQWNISDAEDRITFSALKGSATNLIPSGSILVVNRSGILKHTLPVGITKRAVAINQDIKAFICGKETCSSYIAHIIKAAEKIVLTWVRATTADNFSIENLSRLLIPYPMLAEQQRIAAILDKADALRRKRNGVTRLAASIPQALFVHTFGNAETIAARWHKYLSLSDIAEISSGITKGRKQPIGPLRSVPYLAVANVQDHALDLSSVKSINASESEIEKLLLKNGDLVLTEGGDPDKLGRGTIWRDELPEAIHQNHIFRVRPTDPNVEANYLMHLIGSRYGKDYFLKAAKQTTGIASINKTQLSDFRVPLPPIDLQ